MSGIRISLQIILLSTYVGTLFADNPIITQRYTADPNAFIYNDRLYVICSSDEENTNKYNLLNYTLISSDDMVNWTDHNLVFKVKNVTSWADQAYAPTAVARDGKIYLFFPNKDYSIGVAVADKPEGPYTDHLGKALIDRNTPNCSVQDMAWLFDPCIFIDSTTSSKQAYLVFGGGKPFGNNLCIVKINDDMKSISGTPEKLKCPNSFEGPFLHKYKSKYYLSYPINNGLKDDYSNIDYVMSDDPMGDWTYKGTVLPNPSLNGKNINRSNNSHESMIEYKGKWYMFYHDRIISNADYKRDVSVDILEYNNDGTLEKVIVTSQGPPQIKKFNPYDTIQAETIWKQKEIETEFCNEGGVMVTNISDGDYTSLKGVDFGDGAKSFEVRASSATSGGNVEVHLDKPDGPLVASCKITGTDGWQSWKTFSCDVNNCTGIRNVYFVYKGSNEPFRCNWFRFIPGNQVGIHTGPKTMQPVKGKGTLILNPFDMAGISGEIFFDLSGKMVNITSSGKPLTNKPSNVILIVNMTNR